MTCEFVRCGEKNGKPICCCTRCHNKLYSDDPDQCHASCESRAPNKNRKLLGDRVEDALVSLGVTQERWLQVKEAIGLPRRCKCSARKEWLNKLDAALQLGDKLSVFTALIGFKEH